MANTFTGTVIDVAPQLEKAWNAFAHEALSPYKNRADFLRDSGFGQSSLVVVFDSRRKSESEDLEKGGIEHVRAYLKSSQAKKLKAGQKVAGTFALNDSGRAEIDQIVSL